MPRMDGMTFLNEKKKEEGIKNIPTIILTKKEENDLKADNMNCGIVEYLPKPFNVSKMKEVLKKILEDESS